MAGPPSRHQVKWTASGLRRAAADAGVELPVDFSVRVAADGLARSSELAVTGLGSGVVIHTRPQSDRELPAVVGYADGRGQWYRDGRRHTAPAVGAAGRAATMQVDTQQVAL